MALPRPSLFQTGTLADYVTEAKRIDSNLHDNLLPMQFFRGHNSSILAKSFPILSASLHDLKLRQSLKPRDGRNPEMPRHSHRILILITNESIESNVLVPLRRMKIKGIHIGLNVLDEYHLSKGSGSQLAKYLQHDDMAKYTPFIAASGTPWETGPSDLQTAMKLWQAYCVEHFPEDSTLHKLLCVKRQAELEASYLHNSKQAKNPSNSNRLQAKYQEVVDQRMHEFTYLLGEVMIRRRYGTTINGEELINVCPKDIQKVYVEPESKGIGELVLNIYRAR
jgi:hypothetical protein